MELAKLTLNKFLGYTLQLPYYQSYLYWIVRRRRNFHYIGTGVWRNLLLRLSKLSHLWFLSNKSMPMISKASYYVCTANGIKEKWNFDENVNNIGTWIKE